MGATALRILVLAALAWAGWTVLYRLVALEILRVNPPRDGLDAAVKWDGRNPDLYHIRAVLVRDDPDHPDPGLVESDLAASIRLNPHNARYWQTLAQYRELQGRIPEAREAYRKTVEIVPQSGYYLWQWGNFLLRNGDSEGAFAAMKRSLRMRPEYRKTAGALFLGLGVSAEQMEDIWPRDLDAQVDLLRFYLQRIPKSEAVWGAEFGARIWNGLLKAPLPITPEHGAFYLEFLYNNRRYQELRNAWIAVWRAQGQDVGDFATLTNYCWNGGFELDVGTKPLGWAVRESAGARIMLTRDGSNHYSRTLKIEFEGTQNLNFRNVTQAVIVEPGSEYTVSFRARSDSVSTDQGVFVEISDAHGVLAATKPMLRTNPWENYAVKVAAGQETEVLWIAVRRQRSRRIDSLIGGNVWLDDFKVTSGQRQQRDDSPAGSG